jgi:GTP cyclohydrolase III
VKKINVVGLLKTHLGNGSTPTQAIEAAAFVMRNSSGAQKRFRDRNEFLDNCLGCAKSLYVTDVDPAFTMSDTQYNSILAALGFDFAKGNRLMGVQ